MCCAVYRLLWKDTGCVRVGSAGQKQFGVDIFGHDGTKSVGVQCKHYNKTPFTLSTVIDDVGKAEEANLEIDHLLFATTAPSKAKLVREVVELSNQRRRDGKFTVSVDFWGDISSHILLHPDVGRTYIPGFPGSALLDVKETSETHLSLYQADRAGNKEFQNVVLSKLTEIRQQIGIRPRTDAAPPASGEEADPRVAATLDIVRDCLRQGKSRDALALLTGLGDPVQFRDNFSRFRWHTNHAAIALIEGHFQDAAEEFLSAFRLAPDNEKAHANRAHALLLKNLPEAALAVCDESLRLFPSNTLLWSVKMSAARLTGDPDPERHLPSAISDNADILFARAHLRGTRGDHPSALALLRRCMNVDERSFEVGRAFLANALSWATCDPVAAHCSQLTAAQREALEFAVQRLEPLEQTLSAIQSDHASREVTNNIAIALELLGQLERARATALTALRRHPLVEGLLRIRLTELADREDFEAIRALTDPRLGELPASVLGLLAEISANHGDVPWNDTIVAALDAADVAEAQLRDVRVLAIHARWMAGQRREPIEALERHLRDHPDHALAAVIRGQMLLKSGRNEDAHLQADECRAQTEEADRSLSVLLLADFLFDLRRFVDAASLYARLLVVPGDDMITRRLLACLIESDQRQRAVHIFEQLPDSVRKRSAFRRIQANLARSTGDWALMRDVLSEELNANPADSGIALGYVGALYRLNDGATLNAYLASDPKFSTASPENEFEFAKYQIHHGLTALAITRLYRLYRANTGSVRVASYYLSQLLIGGRIPELETPVSVQSGTVVRLQGATDARVVAIDIDDSRETEAWPELVPTTSAIAKALVGLRSGDHVTLPGPITAQDFEIIGIDSLFTFIAGKAHDQVAAAADPVGPLRSVRIIKDDGTPNVDMLLASARQRSEHVHTVFEAYRRHRFPISMLAKALGTDPVTLLLEWPSKDATLFVSIGTKEERESARAVLQQKGNRYVVDLLTVAELVQRRSLGAASRLLGRPLIPQTAREHLLLLRQQIDVARSTATISEQDGRLHWTDTPTDYYQKRAAVLEAILDGIDKYCEVVPTVGPTEVTDQHRFLADALDTDSLDALYLCIERNAVLFSEDAALRLLAPDAGVPLSIGVQPLMMESCAAGLVSPNVYADAIHDKIASGHEFVSVGADDLVMLALRSPHEVSEKVRTALETFRRPNLELISGVRVACEFLSRITQRVPVSTASEYGLLVLDVLQHGRPERTPVIHRVVAHSVQQSLQQGRHHLTARERRALAPLLKDPTRTTMPYPATTIARAVHEILMACRPRF